MKAALVIHDEPYGDLRVGQGDLFYKIRHMGALCGLRLQKFPPCRCVEKEVSGDKCGSIRCTDLLEAFLLASLDPVSGSRKAAGGLRDQLHLGNCRYAGKCLAAES